MCVYLDLFSIPNEFDARYVKWISQFNVTDGWLTKSWPKSEYKHPSEMLVFSSIYSYYILSSDWSLFVRQDKQYNLFWIVKHWLFRGYFLTKSTAHHLGHRQHSPGAQVRNSNLRVVIPGPMNNTGLQPNDDISYNDVSGKLSIYLVLFFFFLYISLAWPNKWHTDEITN